MKTIGLLAVAFRMIHDFSLNARGLAVNQLITHAQPVSKTYAYKMIDTQYSETLQSP